MSMVDLSMARRSFPAMSGEAIMHQRLKRLRFWASLSPGMPTIIMSGSFQRPGPANAGQLLVGEGDAHGPGPVGLPGPQMSDVVRHMCPMAPAQTQG